MSGMEVVAVIACVAAVVSAYKDAGKIVKQIKAKRAAKRALAPTQSLESSLERGPVAVEQAKDNGIERYGSRFSNGDEVAIEALRSILINLQGSLLRHLWSAQEDDSVTDFHILVDASDFGRVQSVTVLNELYMRMAQAAPLHQGPLSHSSVWEYENSTDAASSNQSASHLFKQRLPAPSLTPRIPPPEDPVQDSNRSPNLAWKKWGIFPPRTRKSELETTSEGLASDSTYKVALPASPLGVHSRESGPSVENLSPEMISERSISTRGLAGVAIASSPWKDLSIDQDNPWREEVSNSNGGVYKAASSEMSIEKRTNTYPALRELTESSREPKPMRRIAPYKPRKQMKSGARSVAESGNPPESKAMQNKFSFMSRRRSTPPPQNHNLAATTSPVVSRTQTHQSDKQGSHHPYGGYCKGAYKLQVGLEKESVNLRNQSVSMTGQSNYWACASSKCAFEGPACKMGKKWYFDETVRKSDAVQYRWSFLAKCHVASPRVYDGQCDYQCVFCGVQPSSRSVYRGQNAFIEHISQQHRGQQPDPSIWDKIRCIYGRVALEEESFDINLSPKEEEHPPAHRQVLGTPNLSPGNNDHDATPDGIHKWPAIEHLSSTSQRE